MINTEAKSLQRDINKILTRLSKLPKQRNTEVRKMNIAFERELRRATTSYDAMIATKKKQLEAEKAALEMRLNLVLGRAGK